MSAAETQAEAAMRMYEGRADTYEDSWHPDYSERFIALVPLRLGDSVLSLCCGTGLDAFLAADRVGGTGRVVGVDISSPMLAKAKERKDRDGQLGPRVTLLRHDVTDLESLADPTVSQGGFDAILCSNAFVLFKDPVGTVRRWKAFLKPGGRVAIDITHEHNLRAGMIIERVAARMGIDFPAYRSWIKSRDSFSQILEQEGFVVESVTELEKVIGEPATYYTIDQSDEQFDDVTKSTLTAPFFQVDESTARAREIFREEWAKDAVDGKVQAVGSLYVYVARKPE